MYYDLQIVSNHHILLVISHTNTYLLLICFYVDSNECSDDPCYHGGQCVDGDNSYTCTCTAGWTGHDCEDGKL